MATDTAASVHRGARDDVARSVWYTGGLLTFLATGEETGGRFALVEEVLRKGVSATPPMHVHSREEESFYVVEGELDFHVGDRVIAAPAGTLVVLPRGVPHTFVLVSEEVRVLCLVTPAGFEGMFRDLGEPARALDLPPVGGPPDRARLLAATAAYAVEVVGPPPAATR